jgi:GT2 family glycosyltransferase/2-polyprenyl-3-methyl-5-hydroxy-6-metoxy-1,4-benzoquinol methylase
MTQDSSSINSREWWQEYFVENWEAHGGGEQTRHFMERLVAELPAPEQQFLRSKAVTILDWGCAFGEGVEVLGEAFPQSRVVGLDFAPNAVAEARRRHPQHEFIVTQKGDIPGEFDCIVTSNCLEHFEHPLEIIKAHLPACRNLYVLLVPYNEYPLHETHRSQFKEESFPERLAGFVRLSVRTIEIDPTYWHGPQLLVVYGSPSYLRERTAETYAGSEQEKWDKYYASLPLVELDEATRAFNADLVERLSELLPEGGKILEAGCGGGWHSLALAQTGKFQVSLMDFSGEALDYARRVFEREQVAAEFIYGDVFTPGEQQFDLVFNAGVLEHYTLERQSAFLRGMASRSRKFVLALVPNRLCYWYWLWRIQKSGYGEWPFGKEVPLADFSQAFEAAGLHFVGQTFMGEQWTEHFITSLEGMGGALAEEILGVHRSPLISKEQKCYLLAALGSISPEQTASSRSWAAQPRREEMQKAELNAALADALALRVGGEQSVAQLRSELSNKDAQLHAGLAEKDQAIASLVANLSDKEQAIASLTANLTEKEQAIGSLTSNLAEKDQSNASLVADLSNKEQLIQTLSGRIAEQDRALHKLSAQMNEVSAQMQERTRALATLNAQLAEKEQSLQSLSAQVEAERRDSQQLLTASEQNLRQLLLEHEQAIRKALIEKNHAVQLVVAEKDQALRALEAQLSDKQRIAQRLSTEVAEKELLSGRLRGITASRAWRAFRRLGAVEGISGGAPESLRRPTGIIEASPNPISVFDGSGLGETVVSWSSEHAEEVEVRVGAPDGELFASGGTGSQITPKWVQDGTTFFLQNVSGGLPLTPDNTLASVAAEVRNVSIIPAMPTGTIEASPNPISVFDGSGLGETVVSWSSEHATEVEVRVGAPDGELFASHMTSGRQTAQKWVHDGTTFFLQDVSGGLPLTPDNTLASVMIRVENIDRTGGATKRVAGQAETDAQPAPVFQQENTYDVICFPIIDWDFRFQRPQQIMSRFAAAGHRVFYLTQKFRSSGKPYEVQKRGENIYEVSLRGRALNVYTSILSDDARDELFDSLDALRRDFSCGATVSFVQLPFWWSLAEKTRAEFNWPVVYDCMDHHAGFSTNEQGMLDQENALSASADLVVVSSLFLEEEVRRQNAHPLLVRNACDYEHFAAAGDAGRQSNSRPVVGYYGAISDWFDSNLVADLAERRPDWDFLLVGSTFSADTSRLSELPNVRLVGEKPYAEIPDWLAEFDAAIIPFKRVPLTEATNPVKAYEMLASGKPVISVPIPEVAALAPLVSLASTPEEFEQQISAALAEADPAMVERRRAFARENTWQRRYESLAPAVTGVFPRASIVVVTFNNLALNRLCLQSIYARTDWPNFEVIVVDNASADGTPQYLRQEEQTRPNLRVVLNDSNLGFAAANNIGIKMATGEYIVLLNNDTVVSRAWLTNMIRHLATRLQVGLIGPVTNEIGNEAKIPVGYGSLNEMPEWAAGHVREHDGQTFEIPVLAMFCVAMRREIVEQVGLLDERFGLGMFEDDDYTRRIKEAGYTSVCAFDSFVHHVGRSSFKLLGDQKYFEIFMRNRSLYEQKWGEMWQPHLDEKDRQRIPGLRRRLSEILAESGVGAGRTVVFLPTIGWSNSLPQRPHHMATELARQGCLVFFDCSGSLVDHFADFIQVEKNLWLYNGPKGVLDTLEHPVLWAVTYNAPFVERWAQRTVVYDWIDDLSVFPYNQQKMEENHGRMLKEADLVLAVARTLIDEAGEARSDILYVPNGVEDQRFASPQGATANLDTRFTRLLQNGRPVVGYYGAVASWLDVELLTEAARLRPDWNFVIIGHQLPDAPSLDSLKMQPNVLVLTAQKYETLPHYLARWTAAMIPFKVNQITQATSPLKLYEYFAGGKPVISAPMSECEAFPEVHIARDAGEFARALDLARAQAEDREFQKRLQALGRENSWTMRVEAVMRRLKLDAGS